MQSTTSSTRTFMPASSAEKEQAKKSTSKSGNRKFKLLWLVIILSVAFSAFMYVQYRDAKTKLAATKNPSSSSQVSDVVSRVGKLIILPTNETPTIVTVQDASKLRGQAFYANAQNGDVTLVYVKAQKAILYRPSANIIVNVAPVSVNSTQ